MSESITYAEKLFIEGNGCMSAGDALKAEECFRKAIGLVPGFAEAHANLGLMLDQKGMLDEAESHYLQAVALDPGLADVHSNLGALLICRKRFAEAADACLRALALTPDSEAAWVNFGVLQICLKLEHEAEQSFRKAIEVDPGNRKAYFNLSYLMLRQGRFEEGWQCLEARSSYIRLDLPCPRWQGESLKGRSLLISFEGGYGDMIQFCRYAAVVKSQGASRITLICHPPLKALFANLDGVDDVFAADETIPACEWDFWTPPMSIPYYCQTRIDSIPAEIPYVRADKDLADKWSSVLAGECSPSDFRVGLIWKGNTRFENDEDRSISHLKDLEPLGEIPGIRFFSLQKGAGEDEAASPPEGLPLVNLGPRISDFADSAAIIANLDLVISVDTAIAHLAGAMGRPCWVLLPDYKTDWRWLTGRTDSPWYPGVMRLFRQEEMGDWDDVVMRVRSALADRQWKPF